MEEDSFNGSANLNNGMVDENDAEKIPKNIFSSSIDISHSIEDKDSRNEFLNSLIDAEFNESASNENKFDKLTEVLPRDELLDSLVDAKLGDSVTNEIKADKSIEMLVENNSRHMRGSLNEISIDDVERNRESNESETSIAGDNAVTVDIIDDHNAGELPDSVSNDDKFVKPKNVLCHFPLGRVKRIVKADPEVPVISAESLFLISKSAELFLRWLGKEVHAYTRQQKRKTIQLRDLNLAISEHPALEFLDGALD